MKLPDRNEKSMISYFTMDRARKQAPICEQAAAAFVALLCFSPRGAAESAQPV
jgi:hypothetical protein